jgi:SAM-dependent methyltransferase
MNREQRRFLARELAHEHLAKGDATGWFEDLYARAGDNPAIIPWADLEPNPHLVAWLDRHFPAPGRPSDPSDPSDSSDAASLPSSVSPNFELRTSNFELASLPRALVIGCGLGDDAEELARRNFAVTAFDISETAIAWARKRFPDSPVAYAIADLLSPPSDRPGAFAFVVESYTTQALPPALRPAAIRAVASLLAPGGTLLVIARGREPEEFEGNFPWPLTRAELTTFESHGLTPLTFEDYTDTETPPARRFRATWRREPQGLA